MIRHPIGEMLRASLLKTYGVPAAGVTVIPRSLYRLLEELGYDMRYFRLPQVIPKGSK